ncbi:mediator of RNA polymerase II transcription subunit 15-like isoform X2 [Diospyros lotus]|uniref:mediator of RNA polymerase II transcription subunit 15-like isoform X2 n=1 Tax=Diospyros lotus TaxID=55363 RepID=UPI0022590FF1|nr:mediator of RNA polymerase II transcription subunit 15-like isoform X2 [Diospyros lotus]
MDLSSLPEDQRQQLQHLQQLFQEHQLQRQQQQQIQEHASQAYDPAQVQEYNQSYYAYYQYQDPQQSLQYSHNLQQQQHDYAYYHPDYGNAYQQQAQHHQNLQPEGQPAPQMAEAGGALGQGQNGYLPLQLGGQNPAYPVPPGLNPAAAAAVAALSQLTQFAGTMEAAERALAMVGLGGGVGGGQFTAQGPTHHGQELFDLRVGPSLHRGGGRRGGRPFRGNGLGNFGNRPPRSVGTGPPFRGRGRGQASLGEEEAEPTGNDQVEPKATQISAPKQGNKASNRQPSQAAHCDLCRVDCTSLEILEQHKNGKRHKKNMQKLEKLQRAGKSVSETHHEPNNIAESNLLLLHTQDVEDKQQTLPENLTTESANGENKLETEQQNDRAEQPENPVAEQSDVLGRKPWPNSFNDQRRGMKRKMRGGRGGKRMKTVDAPRRVAEPPKPKVVIPLICDLCNVKCDTQEVFDRHLSGKKHISKLKKYEDHQAMYDRVGLQALYPPNPLTQTLLLPQGPQQVLYGSQGAYPPRSNIPPQSHHKALSAASISSGFQQNPNHQALGAGTGFDGQTNVPEFQQQAALVLTETKQNHVAAQR